MTDDKKIKSIRPLYKKAITEGIFILLGILIAFLIDASWDNWQEGKDEAQRLSAIKTELFEVQNDLLELDKFYDTQDSLIKEILEEVGAPRKNYGRLDTLLFMLGPFYEYSPRLIAYNDAIQGGNLSKIKSIELRHTLASYKISAETFSKGHTTIRQFFYNEMSPLWGQYTNVRKHVAAGGFFSDYPDIPLQPRYEELVKDLRFSNQLIARSIFIQHIKLNEENLKKDLNHLLVLLDDY